MHCAECGSKYCSGWYEYWDDSGNCRTQGAVDWLTTIALNIVPFTGLGSLYVGKIFDALFELAHGFFYSCVNLGI